SRPVGGVATSNARTDPAPTARRDVVVIGGGPAGLSAALVLGRARRSVTVVDAGTHRNVCSASLHGFLTRDGASPEEFLAAARRAVLPEAARRGPPARGPAGGRRHRADGRAARGRRPRRAVGSRRPPLPVLPRLRGP